MKKYWRISLLLVVVVIVACQQQLQFEDDLLRRETLLSKEGLDISPTALAKQSTLKENGLPDLTFKTNENGKAILILKDYELMGSDLPSTGKITLTYKSKLTHFIQDSFAPGHTVRLRLPNLPTGGTVLQAEIQYFSVDGKPVKSYNYDVFVLPDGSSALQLPKHTAIRITATVHFVDDWQGETSRMKVNTVVVNDPAGIVNSVQVVFNKASDNFQIPEKVVMEKESDFYGAFGGNVSVTENPTGIQFNITTLMMDINGKIVGEPSTKDVTVEQLDFKGIIKQVKMKEQGEDGFKIIAVVQNANPLEIARVEFEFNEPFVGARPLKSRWDGEYKDGKNPGTWTSSRFISPVQFSGTAGNMYNVTATMIDLNGKAVGLPVTLDVRVEGAFKGISKVAIKESAPGSGKFLIGALVENVNENKLDYVDVKFMEPFNGPQPNQISFRMRKRPELLFQAWDDVISDHLSEIQNNPLFVSNDPVVNPLFFEKSAVGSSYSIIMTTYNTNGKPVGEPQSFEVKVEGTVASDEPVVLSSTLTSKDNGLTWDITVTIDDKGKWVEKVIYEFAKPYAGPASLVNPITLVRTGEASGAIEVYSASGIKFEKSPEGFTYDGLIYQFGSGTRTSAGQASSKAELL